jgi:tetratricopeptide (TPR) repeat protein
MMKTILFYTTLYEDEDSTQEFQVLSGVLDKATSDFEVVFVNSKDQFEKLVTTNSYDAVVIDWVYSRYPNEIVEIYFLSDRASCIPIILYSQFGDEVLSFLAEYDVKEKGKVTDRLVEDSYQPFVKILNDVLDASEKTIKLRMLQIRIRFHLNNKRYANAKKMFATLKPHLTREDKVYYHCLILKEEGKYEAALKFLEELSMPKTKILDLIGACHYGAKSYADAAAIWTKIDSDSSINLRRKYLTYRAFDRLTKTNKTYAVNAMTTLVSLNKMNPHYGKINDKIIRLIISNQSVEQMPLIEKLMELVTPKEIMKIFQLVDSLKDPFKSTFKKVFIKGLSRRAGQMVKNDDMTAIKLYSYISKLIPEDNMQQQSAVTFGIARAYFYFGQLDTAKKHNDKALLDSNREFSRAVDLEKLIDKAISGDFDVLLDKEDDWQVGE